MRYRFGHILRLIIGLAFFVFLIPFLMSKLDSGSSRSTAEEPEVDYSDAKKYDKEDSNVQSQSKNRTLQPIMSDSLGNYEPKNLPPRSGPGEGGKRKFHYTDN